ncbi:5-guanidino-2-oxopentanoate decarboxylase [Solwaraspora sp. WMMD406]|uniref:5-guanidino-2-oxopentanoate decarboxylase n=1 Tax=Solwaraspora sp. WMMD406 TaxID=3016095 RepID=UPI00241699D6|nr:5-guanidino-2-oxopentanoate decarboxylase [Solwaraspora sp. WMMD406]MDG4768195.1 5-guanidino-2-oxopentanoate decarboxylase [Solwaraspora sp. WMMD406]
MTMFPFDVAATGVGATAGPETGRTGTETRQAGNGGTAVVSALAAEGVEVVFGIPGTHNLELYRALADTPIRHITTRHEQGAGYAADGYARATGHPGVCFVTSGPAVNNIASAVGTAHADSIPLLVVAPGPPRGQEGADIGGLHEMRDQRGHMAGVAERSVRVDSAAQAATVIHETFARWRTARQRPVFLEVPLDVLDAAWDGQHPPRPSPPPGPAASSDDLARAAELLAAAGQPALLVGRGAIGAAREVRHLAELLAAPVVTTVTGKGVLDETHPLSVGASVRLGPAQELLTAADTVLVVGSTLSDAELWGWRPELPGTVIRIDIDAGSLTKNLVPALAVHADASAALHALAERLASDDHAAAVNPATLHAARSRAGQARDASAAVAARDAGPWAPLNQALSAALPATTIVAGDSSQVTYYGTAHHWTARAPMRLLYPTIYATLGYGLPAGIGAKLGRPEAPVVVLVGDGALMFSVAELATAVEQRIALPVIVVNNHGFGEIRDGMLAAGIAPVGVELVTPDFALLGRAFGAYGVRVTGIDDLVDATRRALDADRPTVIEVDADTVEWR